MSADRQLHAVMYHYVQDPARARFPKLHGMSVAAFRAQVAAVSARWEMATLESALAFLRGAYAPRRDMCLLTFDDGLREHGAEVLEILAPRGIQGLFFLITGVLEEGAVAPVHASHLLMAALPFAEYRRAFFDRLAEIAGPPPPPPDPEVVRRHYRWDAPEVAAFKYVTNFGIAEPTRNRVLGDLLARHLGDAQALARDFYLSWDDARRMLAAGMALGAHSHRHARLAGLAPAAMEADLRDGAALFRRRLGAPPRAFSYPYGKETSFNAATVAALRALDFACAFTSERGANSSGADLFRIRRVDPKDVTD